MKTSPKAASAAAVVLAVLLSACVNETPSRPNLIPVFTPVGELLAASAAPEACRPQIEAWFDRADLDRSGGLSRSEFEAEARRVFPLLDTDGDGLVTSLELSARRGRLGPPRDTRPGRRIDTRDGPSPGGMGRGRGGGEMTGSSEVPRPARGPERGEGAPDPVMAADANLDFRVSQEEFVAHAGRRFDQLDRGRRGLVDRAAVAAACEQVSPPG